MRSMLTLLAVLALTTPALGNTAAAEVEYSPDITVDLSGQVATDEDVAADDGVGTVTLRDLGVLPPQVEVDAYEPDGGDHLFSLDTTALLTGSVVASPGDVVRYNGSTYSIEFDASAAGLPDGADVDAVALMGSDLVISFDTTVDLGGGLVAHDEDLVLIAGGGYSLVFDGSAAGLDPAIDLDAASVDPGGAISLSFDTAGTIGAVVFDDDTVVRFTGTSWSTDFDASDLHPDFESADLVAVPEPSAFSGIAAGVAVLFVLGSHHEQQLRRKMQ